MFTILLHALPFVLAGAFILIMLYGFWQGLGMRPNKPENRVPDRWHWWPGPGSW
jgi:hypothetical protein